MELERNRSVITIGAPKITPAKTETLHGRWITSGSVEIPIMQGGNAAFGSLVFPYKDAASETDALTQAIGPLEAVLTQLAQALARLKEASGERATKRWTHISQ